MRPCLSRRTMKRVPPLQSTQVPSNTTMPAEVFPVSRPGTDLSVTDDLEVTFARHGMTAVAHGFERAAITDHRSHARDGDRDIESITPLLFGRARLDVADQPARQ